MQRDGIRISNDKELVSAAYEFLDGVLSYFAFSVSPNESGRRLYNACVLGETAKEYLSKHWADRTAMGSTLFKAEEMLELGYQTLKRIENRSLKKEVHRCIPIEDFNPLAREWEAHDFILIATTNPRCVDG